MTMRVCSTPGCGNLVLKAGRCARCAREYEQQRGNRHARGYDSKHVKRRRELAPAVAAGKVKCWRCGKFIRPGQLWDLGHDDLDRTKYRGAECIACNRGARPLPPVPHE